MANQTKQAPAVSLARTAGWLATVVGALGVATIAFELAFAAGVPEVVMYANLGAAVLEIGLGLGILRRQRAAWAFALSLEGTVTLVNLFALPQMARAGMVGGVSIAFAAARAMLFVLLILSSEEH